jgi:ubiquinone/menaquinone biosynthesis C-methylase UbiE
MNMQDNVIVKLYKSLPRQAPGDDRAIEKALQLTELDQNEKLAVLNIGCGTGAQALKLASLLPNAQIAAIDEEKSFLDELNIRKHSAKGAEINTVHAPYNQLPVLEKHIDLIWSEGTSQDFGFRETLEYWKTFLKPGGYIVLSELSWLTHDRPNELENFWQREHPEMSSVSDKIGDIQRAGLLPVAHIILPEEGWTDNYYDPIMERTPSFLQENKERMGTLDFVTNMLKRMNMYSKYNNYYSYVYYIIKKM